MPESLITLFFGSVDGLIIIEPFSPLALILLPLPLFFLRRRRKALGYLLCFSVFYFYAWTVAAYTMFPWPASLEMTTYHQAQSWYDNINLTPALLKGDFSRHDPQVYGNLLLGVPFGWLFPFIARTTHKRFVWQALAFGTSLELAQVIIGLALWGGPYRVIDIDDVWLVFAGALLGYAFLLPIAHVYRRIGWERGARIAVWEHFHGVLMRVSSAGGGVMPSS